MGTSLSRLTARIKAAAEAGVPWLSTTMFPVRFRMIAPAAPAQYDLAVREYEAYWARVVGEEEHEDVVCIVPTPDGGLVVIAIRAGSPSEWISRYDWKGRELWSRGFDTPDGEGATNGPRCRSVHRTHR